MQKIDRQFIKKIMCFFLFAEETDNEAWQIPDERQPVLATLSTGLSVIKKDQGRNILLTPWESAQLTRWSAQSMPAWKPYLRLRSVMQGIQEGWPLSLPLHVGSQSHTIFLPMKPAC